MSCISGHKCISLPVVPCMFIVAPYLRNRMKLTQGKHQDRPQHCAPSHLVHNICACGMWNKLNVGRMAANMNSIKTRVTDEFTFFFCSEA